MFYAVLKKNNTCFWHSNKQIKNNCMFQKMVGCLRQQEILTGALNSHRSELIAIYGRRRIGKTYLVRTFFGKQIKFSFIG